MTLETSKIKMYLTDLLLPNRCPGCGKLLIWDKLMCDACRSKLIPAQVCPVCGKKPCADHSSLRFDRAICLYEYSGKCKEAIYSLKYNGGINFAIYCGKKLGEMLEEQGISREADAVCCVPMSRRKKRRRGYNHAQILARYVAKELDKPLYKDLLLHSDTLTEHHRLSAAQRRENARKSFSPGKNKIDLKSKTFILCDDIYTTGSTMNACADQLKQMGAKKVIAVSIATTMPENDN